MQQHLGTFLRQQRMGRGWSLNRLAQAAGISQSTLSRWEAEKTLPRLPELEMTLTALGATPEQHKQALGLLTAPRAVQRLREETSLPGEWRDLPPPSAGGLLRAMRLRHKRTLEDVARQIGVQKSTLLRWEHGETWPDAQKLHALCYALQAREPEVAALTCGPGLAFAGWEQEVLSLDALNAQLESVHGLPTLHPAYPLKDLLFLQLEARVWHLLDQPRYVGFIRSVYAAHASYLNNMRRYQEAYPYVDFALQEGVWERSQSWWMYAAIVMAQCEIYGGKRPAPQRGLDILKAWQPCIQRPDFAAWVCATQAECLLLAGETEQALVLSRKACEIARNAENPLEYAVRLRNRVRMLIRVEQPQNALTLLEGQQANEVIHRTSVALLRTEAFLGLNRKRPAQEELSAAQTLIDTHHIERFQARADALALQCQ